MLIYEEFYHRVVSSEKTSQPDPNTVSKAVTEGPHKHSLAKHLLPPDSRGYISRVKSYLEVVTYKAVLHIKL